MKIVFLALSAIVIVVWNCEAFELGTVDIHGFLSQGYLQSNNNNFYADTEDGTLQLNEFGLNFSSDLTDRMRVGLQLLSRDLGTIGNNELELNWAYGIYRWKDWLELNAGLLKIEWGLYNDTRDIDMLRTPIFLPASLYAERQRDLYSSMLGVALGGNFYTSALSSVSYSLAYGEKGIAPDSGFVSFLEFPDFVETTDTNVKNIVSANIKWSTPFLEGLRLGLSLGRYDWNWAGQIAGVNQEGLVVPKYLQLRTEDSHYLIASAEYIWNDLVLAAEYVTVREKEPHDLTGQAGTTSSRSEGFYGSAAYRFNDFFELGVYYSVNYPNRDDKDGKRYEEKEGNPVHHAWQKEFVLTTRFDITEHWLVKLEGHFINGTANFINADNPQGLKEDSFLFAAKTTFNF